MGSIAYDGHANLRGVWGGAPGTVPQGFAHNAVNRWFRGDENKARPSFQTIELEFESEADRIWFEGANVQGAFFYNRYPSFENPEIILSIAGKIFRILILGRRGIVRVLFDGNAREMLHAWFGQGFNFLFIQDGIHAPIIWDGTNAARRSDLTKKEMPTGSVMDFIHGRMVVASADGKNQIFVGDIAYSDDKTTPSDIIQFTEQQYWAEGGSFGAPIFIGDIMGLYAMPYLDVGSGQNELVVLGTDGFTALDISGPRQSWIDTQVQRVSMIGQGAVSSHGFDGLNGDLFYRRADGIGSYRNARFEYSQAWRQTPLSREVDYWLKYDRRDLLNNVPMVSFQNMIICGVSPMWSPPNSPCAGFHRYCRGMVVFDAEPASTTGRDGNPVWHGMWTGIRPTAFVRGRIGNAERCFSFSYDRDGRNRLYEITTTEDEDYFGDERRKIFGFYTTGELGTVEARTNAFQPKRLNGGMIEISRIRDASEFFVDYMPDSSECWIQVDTGRPGCDCPTPVENSAGCLSSLSAPQHARKYFEELSDSICIPGGPQIASLFHHSQVRVRMTGIMRIDRMMIRMDLQPDAELAECLGNQCEAVECCPGEYDYVYHIAPLGVNTEAPDVPCPIVPPARFTSTRPWTATCPNFPSMSVTAWGQGESDISQADADAKALANAQTNANAALDCPNCTPETLDDFTIDGGNQDLSAFFVFGLYAGNQGQPWRLVDVFTEAYIASGIVNEDGTLETFQLFPAYAHGAFDPITNIYTDNGGGSTQIALELGCNIGGEPTYPTHPIY